MYAIPEYGNVFFSSSVMSRKSITAELHLIFIMNERKRLLLTPDDIFQNQSNYPTVCVLLDTTHRADHCITFCHKWMFDYNLKLALPLTRAWLNYIYSGNDTDTIEFIAVLRAIRAVPPEDVQKILCMK